MCLFLLIFILILILDLNHLFLPRTCYYKLLLPILTYLYIFILSILSSLIKQAGFLATSGHSYSILSFELEAFTIIPYYNQRCLHPQTSSQTSSRSPSRRSSLRSSAGVSEPSPRQRTTSAAIPRGSIGEYAVVLFPFISLLCCRSRAISP